MDKVRIGVIGVGGMGYGHCKSAKSLEETELTCVGDIDEKTAKEKAKEFGVEYFTDNEKLIGSGLCDALVVATPHWFHPEISECAMENDLHVLSEKPIAVTVSGGDRMVKAAKKKKRVFAVMHQLRTLPAVRKAIEIVDSGALGTVQRTLFTELCYRSQPYYDSGAWRATWSGEGGGVLINQAPHGMDIFMRLCGLPKRVEAKTRVKLHKIEVEDEASALLEYESGAWGYYYATTCEPGGGTRLELVGDKGKLILSGQDLEFYEFSPPVSEFTFADGGMWDSLDVKQRELEVLSDVPTGHAAIIQNFARAILYDEPLLSPGEDGLQSVEFLNALILSGKKGKPVDIPVDRGEYDSFMEDLKKSSKAKKNVKVQRITDPNLAK